MLNPHVEQITAAIELRSQARRSAYLQRMQGARERPRPQALGCSNLAHALAAQNEPARLIMRQGRSAHIGIVSSYNDLLSAHAPLREYPEQLKATLLGLGASAQFAAGVPAMCDGITQGEAGMQLSLFSRDLIAQAAAIGLSHGIFDGAHCTHRQRLRMIGILTVCSLKSWINHRKNINHPHAFGIQ